MFLTDVRTRFQFRLGSLFRRPANEKVSKVLDDGWLTQREAAQMLQPHMPNRNALAWLELDRNVDPSLPFFERLGEIHYWLSDVRAFVRRMPKSSPTASTGGDRPSNESTDRRTCVDRRNSEYELVSNERRELIDRRSGFDRRNGYERRRTKDDFGYGRNGERRGLRGKA